MQDEELHVFLDSSDKEAETDKESPQNSQEIPEDQPFGLDTPLVE